MEPTQAQKTTEKALMDLTPEQFAVVMQEAPLELLRWRKGHQRKDGSWKYFCYVNVHDLVALTNKAGIHWVSELYSGDKGLRIIETVDPQTGVIEITEVAVAGRLVRVLPSSPLFWV